MNKSELLGRLVEQTWEIATKARDGADPREVEFLLEDLERQLAEALGVSAAS